MTFSEITTSGAIPVLEATMRFAARRQPIITGNIANIETPDFRPMDVSVRGFQRALAAAVEERRKTGDAGEVRLDGSREVRQAADGSLELSAHTPSPGVLFHDRNNRDYIRLMQD